MTSAILTSRFRFPEDRMSFVYQRPGQPILTPPRTGLKLFLDEAGTIPADVQSLDGATIAHSTIYTGDDALLPEFLGPPGFVARIYARVVGGTAATYPLMAQYSDRLANLPMLVTGDGPPAPDVGAVGSFYIDVGIEPDPNVEDDPVLYGPRTVDGWPAAGTHIRGPQGAPGANDEWVQASPNATWEITHILGFRPTVTTIDSAGQEIHGDVEYPVAMPNKIIVRFGAPESGIAILT
jgi:hypothetical protein